MDIAIGICRRDAGGIEETVDRFTAGARRAWCGARRRGKICAGTRLSVACIRRRIKKWAVEVIENDVSRGGDMAGDCKGIFTISGRLTNTEDIVSLIGLAS